MSIHDNVFDLTNAITEQQKRERIAAWWLSLDDTDRYFYLGLAKYLEKHPERLAALKQEPPA